MLEQNFIRGNTQQGAPTFSDVSISWANRNKVETIFHIRPTSRTDGRALVIFIRNMEHLSIVIKNSTVQEQPQAEIV